jgi:hypothetical protein
MMDRQKGINQAYEKTFAWAVDPDPRGLDNSSAQTSPFSAWLRSKDPLFWISGKAGCGKSTLMKYVCYHPKIETELLQWADGKELVQASFFLFEQGKDDLQKSREGMLRSILYQILSGRRNLVPIVFRNLLQRDLRNIDFGSGSWGTLQEALTIALDHLSDSKICLFIDGLDEYRILDRLDHYKKNDFDLLFDGPGDSGWGISQWITDGHKEVAQLFLSHQKRANIKICLSSRELPIFNQQFQDLPTLRVHKHTASDISLFCNGQLHEKARGLEDVAELAMAITVRSQGVFLWVRLVIEMMADGHAHGNTKDELLGTLEKLPKELGELYFCMMQSVQDEYLPEAKRLFQIVLDWKGQNDLALDIITLFFAAQEGQLVPSSSPEILAKSEKFCLKTWEELKSHWMRLQSRLKSRCGGLLEGTEDVWFMHQTAKEFISRKGVWDRIFRDVAGFRHQGDTELAILSGLIRRLKCWQETLPINPSQGSLSEKTDVEYLEMLWTKEQLSYRGFHTYSSIFEGIAIDCSNRQDPPEGFFKSWVDLLDELDKTGQQLIEAWKSRFPQSFLNAHNQHRHWTDLIATPTSGTKYILPRPDNFTTSLPIFRYGSGTFEKVVMSMAKGRALSQADLQRLLLTASGFARHKWKSSGSTEPDLEADWDFYNSLEPGTVRILLEKGADPNFKHEVGVEIPESWGTMRKTRHRLSAWMLCLEYGREYDMLRHFGKTKSWCSIVKLFIDYGANVTVLWASPSPSNKPGIYLVEKLSPDSIIEEIIEIWGECQDELAEIQRILGDAAAGS